MVPKFARLFTAKLCEHYRNSSEFVPSIYRVGSWVILHRYLKFDGLNHKVEIERVSTMPAVLRSRVGEKSRGAGLNIKISQDSLCLKTILSGDSLFLGNNDFV